jgi:hypothetical protein
MATAKQIRANRENALKGGVKTERGKAISRLNALRHNIFTSGLTTEDAEELYGVEDQLIAALQPVGRIEEMLVEKLALAYLRMHRCARAEAEYHARTWEEPNPTWNDYEWRQQERKRELGVRTVTFRENVFTSMVGVIDLYDRRLTNQFLKLLHEIERLQRLRAGENVPPPIVAEVNVQADAGDALEAARALPEPPAAAEVEKPFDVAQDKPFDVAQGAPQDAQGKSGDEEKRI